MTPYVIDANAIHAFQEERINGVEGEAHLALRSIFMSDCVALDEESICIQEWIDCAGGAFPFALTDWISDEIVSGHIKIFSLSDNTCRKLLLQLGIPQKDHKWVRLAIGCNGRKLVSGDIDFFDPSKKQASRSVKQAIRSARRGPCVKALKKAYRVDVLCLEHVPDEVLAA